MDEDYGLFAIQRQTRDKEVTQVDLEKMFDNDANYRKAHVAHMPKPQKDTVFNDPAFKLEADDRIKEDFGPTVKTRRIFELYDE